MILVVKFKIAKLDIDDNERVAKEYGIRVPLTLLFFKNSQVVGHIQWASSKESVRRQL